MARTEAAPPARTGRRRGWFRRHWDGLTPRRKKILGLALGGLVVLFVGLCGAVYAATKIPLPSELRTDQTTVILYDDGRTELGRLQGEENRTDIPLATVPQHVRDAVLAAEDRDYYKHSGVSFRGMLRAAVADVRGGTIKQGGSTITQQYARNAYLDQRKTFARKFREAVIAVKLDRKYSKDQVLEFYLNTIYFGRGAYGVEAAARTYFGVPADRLSVEQGALLAALIRSPEGGDPSIAPNTANRRWKSVLDAMVSEGKLAQPQADGAVFPKVRDRGAGGKGGKGRLSGPNGYVIEAVRQELVQRGFSEAQIQVSGLRVTTTISKKAQDAAVRAVEQTLDEPKDPASALVSVEAKTGRVKAMYGGRDYSRKQFNLALDGLQPPGSAFKPYVLAAALDEGISLKSRYDGRSPQKFQDYTVENFGDAAGEQFGRIDLVEATVHSVNTIYVPLGLQARLPKVIDMAHAAGVPEDDQDKEGLQRPVTLEQARNDASVSLGTKELHVLDQAVGFATFANGGKRVTPLLVQEVRGRDGEEEFKAEEETSDAVDEDVTRDVSFALQQVVQRGTAKAARLDGGRPAAAKTGTASNERQENTDAWLVGYTPSLSTAVWVGYEDNRPMKGVHGLRQVTGGTLPSEIWKSYMDAALAGTPVEQFPPPAFVGDEQEPSPSPTPSPTTKPCPDPAGGPVLQVPVNEPCPTPSPTPTPSQTASPSPRPSPTPSPTRSPSPTPTPTPTPSPSPTPTLAPTTPAATQGSTTGTGRQPAD